MDRYDMLLVMGGPMNIYEEAKYAWLKAEKRAIRAAVDADKIVVGICLGAQLIADALGARVVRGEHVEIGWLPIERADDCPADLMLPDSLRVYHWHGDTFPIPEGAHRLASSPGCKNQGFIYKDRVLALQCHLESTPESVDALIHHCGHEITTGPYIQDADLMRAESNMTYTAMHAVLFKLLDQITRHV